MMVIAAICTMRLTKFPAVRNWLFCDWKMIAMRIRPTMIGREASPPEWTPAPQARAKSAGADAGPPARREVAERLVGSTRDAGWCGVGGVDGRRRAHAVTSAWTW